MRPYPPLFSLTSSLPGNVKTFEKQGGHNHDGRNEEDVDYRSVDFDLITYCM